MSDDGPSPRREDASDGGDGAPPRQGHTEESGYAWHANAPAARAGSQDGRGDAGGPQAPREAPQIEVDDREDRESLVTFLKELPVLLLIAFVLAFVLRTFVVQVFYIPSSSMEPTLQVNDRMLVEKVTYRFREPRRGEVVVFEGENATSDRDRDRGAVSELLGRIGQFVGVVPVNARDFVKRVIGLPGDRIRIDDQGTVFVNGTAIEEPYITNQDRRPFGEVAVPEDSLFVLGDNRPNSSDSRTSLGFIPRGDVVGRAVVIIWPPGHLDTLGGAGYDVPDADAADAAGSALRPAA